MKRIIAITVASLFVAVAHLPAHAGTLVPEREGWVDVSNDGRFKWKKGSIRLEKNRNGDPLVVVTEAFFDEGGRTALTLTGVRLKDCARGEGPLYNWDLETNSVLYTNPFVFGSGTVASNQAELLCTAARGDNKPSSSAPQPGRQPQGQMERQNPRSGSWS